MPVNSAPGLGDRFAAEMARIGGFEPRPRLAVAVSGGADSTALVLLARDWAVRRGGTVLALIVDHGLRAESPAEADATLDVLAALGIPGQKLTVADLVKGSALAERAREARYRLLLHACASAGVPHLLLGHHRSDQVETVMMRVLAGSTARGLAGMPAVVETRFVRLLRPLLGVAPSRLRAMLIARGVSWIEDPSNRDRNAQRARLRGIRADVPGTGEGTAAVAQAARQAGDFRAARDRAVAQTLAERATIRPEGYALLTPGAIEPEALAALLRTIAGTRHAPPIDRVAALARALRPATLGGVRIAPAGRLGDGWLLVRERRAIQGPVRAELNVVWDGRFRLAAAPPGGLSRNGPEETLTPGAPTPDTLTLDTLSLGALGADAARFRNRYGPPTLVLHGLPALRLGHEPLAVPHIGVGDPRWHLLFDPRNSAAGAPFLSGC